jgi:hypothetical protein
MLKKKTTRRENSNMAPATCSPLFDINAKACTHHGRSIVQVNHIVTITTCPQFSHGNLKRKRWNVKLPLLRLNKFTQSFATPIRETQWSTQYVSLKPNVLQALLQLCAN